VRSKGRIFLVVFLTLILPCSAAAVPRGEYIPGSRYLSGRGSAMGDAFFPLANDAGNSMFYNPAGLGEVKKKVIEPLNLAGSVNLGYLANFNALQFFNVFSLGSYSSQLNAATSSGQGVSGSVYPNAAFRLWVFTFGFGVLMQSRLQAYLQTDGTTRYVSRYELAPVAGLGIRIAGGVVKLGYSLAWVNRVDGDVTTGTPTSWNDGLGSGSGLSQNASATLTFPWKLLPSVHFVARNLLGVQYTLPNVLLPIASNVAGAPTSEPMSLDAGISIQPKLGRGATLSMALVYRDILNASNAPLLRHFALSTELNLRDRFFFRGGVSLEEWSRSLFSGSAGFGLRTKVSELNFSWFMEDPGTADAPEQDHRFLFQYILKFD
jgi:hypothetical protein